MSARRFVADARRIARPLAADGGPVINLCQDRYRFAVLFAACLIAGRVCLLTGDHGERSRARLHARFAGSVAIDDAILLQWGLARWGEAADLAGAWPPPAIAPAQHCAIVLTSGSTGEPAAVPKLWGELVARSRAAAERFVLPGDGAPTVIGTVPPHHMYGFETTVLLPLHAGSSSWCGPVFYPADIAAALQAVPGPRILVTTPIHLRALLEQAPARPPEQVISATAPLDPALAQRIERQWGATLWEIFGATEVGSIASRRTVCEPDWTLYPGLALDPPEEAAIVRAPYAPPAALGDRVERLEGGRRFRLIGRSGDLVKIGGRRASLSSLTRILTGLPGVEDGVFLAPDDLEERPLARLVAVVVAPGCNAQSLLDALRREIDPLFLPRRLILRPALPRNATGKLPRQALLDLLGTDPDG